MFLEDVQVPPSFSCAFPLERPGHTKLTKLIHIVFPDTTSTGNIFTSQVRTVSGALVVVDKLLFFPVP
jgi:hypothetical protein